MEPAVRHTFSAFGCLSILCVLASALCEGVGAWMAASEHFKPSIQKNMHDFNLFVAFAFLLPGFFLAVLGCVFSLLGLHVFKGSNKALQRPGLVLNILLVIATLATLFMGGPLTIFR